MHGARLDELVQGRLLERDLPLGLTAAWCDVHHRFIPKKLVPGRFRAISRNGRVLAASRVPLEELTGQIVRVRLQRWQWSILADDEAAGLILHIGRPGASREEVYDTELTAGINPSHALWLDLGGRLGLAFRLCRAVATPVQIMEPVSRHRRKR
jgi:hypothetical protein